MNPLRSIWERYILVETLKVFFLFLVCFFAFYIAIDYSIHMQRFLHSRALSLPDIGLYYGLQFIKHANVLIPLALLVATIRVLTNLNSSRELLALQAGGLHLRRILRPFLLLGIAGAAFNLANVQYLLPRANDFIDTFSASHLKQPSEKRNARMRVLDLKDGSRLAFQKFNKETTTFHDLFWIRSSDDIWRIKTLRLDKTQPNAAPMGYFVDHIARSSDSGLHKAASYPSLPFEQLKASAFLQKRVVQSRGNRSLSALVKSLNDETNSDSAHYYEMLSALTTKCALPFLSPLVILSIAPACARFRRYSSPFLFYVLGIFGFIAFFVLINAASILGQNQVFSPIAAILAPLVVAYSFSLWKYWKT